MKRRRNGDESDGGEGSDLERLLSLLQCENDPVKTINSIRSILTSNRQHGSRNNHQKEDISSLLLSSKLLLILECDFYWLLDQSGVLDFRKFLTQLSDAKQTLKLSTFLRRALLNESSHTRGTSDTHGNGIVEEAEYEQKVNYGNATSIASDICIFLFHLIAKDESTIISQICESVLEEMLGIERNECISSSSLSSSSKSVVIPLISPQDLSIFVDLCLILVVANKTSTSHKWMTNKLRYFLQGIVDSSPACVKDAAGLTIPTSLSIVNMCNNIRKIIGPDIIFDCIRDMVHSSETSMFDPNIRLMYTKQSPLHNSTFLQVLLGDGAEYVDRVQELATSALRIALNERKHDIVMRSVGFAEWILRTNDFEHWLDSTIVIQQGSSSADVGQVTNSHGNDKIELISADVASFFFFAMCELVQQFSKVSMRVLSKTIRSRRQLNKEAADVFLAGARTRQRELDVLYNPLPSNTSSSTIDCFHGIRPERITNWASSLSQFHKLPSTLEQLCNNVQPHEVLRAMQSLDLSDTNLRSNCVVIAKAMFEGGMCSINQFEEFQFALQGTPTSNMSTSLRHLNVTDDTISKAIHECFHVVSSLMHRIMQANEINAQLVHDTSCQWRHLCYQAGIGLHTNSNTTSILILSTLLFQMGNTIDIKIAATLGNTMNYENHDIIRGNLNQLLLWVSLFDCFFTVLLSVKNEGGKYNCIICSIIDTIGESRTTVNDELSRGASFSISFLPIDSIWEFSKIVLTEYSDVSQRSKFHGVLNTALEQLSTLKLIAQRLENLGKSTSDSTFSSRPNWSERYTSHVGPMYLVALLFRCGISYSTNGKAVDDWSVRYFYEAEKYNNSRKITTSDILSVLNHEWWRNVLRLLECCDYSNGENFEHCIMDIYTCISTFISNEEKEADIDVWNNMLTLSSIDFSLKSSTANRVEFMSKVHKRTICNKFIAGVMKGIFTHLKGSKSFFTKTVPVWMTQGLLNVMTPGASRSHMESIGILISALLQLLVEESNEYSKHQETGHKQSDRYLSNECIMRWVILFTSLQCTLSPQGVFELSPFSRHVQMILLDSPLCISCRAINMMRVENCNRVYVNYVHTNMKEHLYECFLYAIVNNGGDVSRQSIATMIGKVSSYQNEQTVVKCNTIKAMGWTYGRLSLIKGSPDYNFEAIDDDIESYVTLLKTAAKDDMGKNQDMYRDFLTCAICGCLLIKLFNGEHIVPTSTDLQVDEQKNPNRPMRFVKRCCRAMDMDVSAIECEVAQELVKSIPVMVVVCCLKQFREIAVNLALGLDNDDEKSQEHADIDNVINCGPLDSESITLQSCVQYISADCARKVDLTKEIEEFTTALAAPIFRQAELNFME